jgi:hypothetical protein
MSDYGITLYNIDKSLCVRYTFKEVNVLKYYCNNIITIINYLTKDIYYYNNKILIYDNIVAISVKYIICRLINECIDSYTRNMDIKNIQFNYVLLVKEYQIKNLKDKCIKEIIKYVIFRQYIKLYKKNELYLDIQHIMILNFKFAKKIGYEFIPKGFKDSF